jgi:hypothetical protein
MHDLLDEEFPDHSGANIASEASGTLFPPGPRPGLSPARPSRPADAEVLTASDETWSDIGRSLLALAERHAQRMAALMTA